jgi:hypothetical protein
MNAPNKGEGQMRIIRVEFDTEIPDGVEANDILAWLEFELHANGILLHTNPMIRTPLTAIFNSITFTEKEA